MAVGLPQGPSYPGHSPPTNHFFAVLPPERPCRRAARSFFKIGRLSSLFSCLSLVRFRLLVFILLLNSDNVHHNPGPVFRFSVCAGNVTWRGRSVQCCTWSKWVHLRCSLLSFSKFRNSELLADLTPPPPPPLRPCFFRRQHYDFLVGFLQVVHLHCLIWPLCPLVPMQLSRPTLAFNPPIPLPPTFCLLPLHPHHRLMLLAVSLPLLLPLSPLTSSGLFNGMLAVSEPGALNYLTFFRCIPLTIFVCRNPILTHLPLSGSLDSMLRVLIASTPGLIFFIQITHTHQQRSHHFRQAGIVLLETFYLFSFFA